VNSRKPLADCLSETYPWCLDWEEELRKLFRGYVARKQTIQSLDYDDLLLYWSYLVSDAEFAAEIGSWFDHILVDEYQDTNVLQSDILHAIRPDGRGVTVVGDDAQSIYSFRAAEVDNILTFPDRYLPGARIVSLDQNYRSSQPILDSANCLIAESERQYRKNLFSAQKGGGKPRYVSVEDCDAEAEFVVEAVLGQREEGLELKHQAVLFRSSHHSDRLELELVRQNIPYVKYGGLKFLEAGHVKDLLSILKWGDNPRNEVAAFRVLKFLPGLGPSNASRCFEFLAENDYAFSSLGEFVPPAATRADWPQFCELMTALSSPFAGEQAWQSGLTAARKWYQPHLERLYDGLDTREADLEQLEQISGKYPTRERFLTELTLDPPSAAGDLAGDPLLDEDYLVLSTVHSAKGQEWDAVFVLNFTDGNFPSEFATGKPKLIDEERRLLYVAMTRAKQSLTLVAPLRFHVTQQRRDGDKHVYGARSRFLTDRLLATMETASHGRMQASIAGGSRLKRKLDVSEKLREMF
jgi:DNA helicase-2/ATP-dependent DNA helicase PcrA